jgi:hypothetical protein
MNKYPTSITSEILKTLSNISEPEIRSDIKMTQWEIETLSRQCNGLKILSEGGTPESKMAYIQLTAKEALIKDCTEFVVFLESVLKARKA